MRSVSPNYYAAGVLNTEFELVGQNFHLIPQDAVGLYSSSNTIPLMYKDSTAEGAMYRINVIDDSHLTATAVSPQTSHGNNYLGGIVSADRSTVYWVNDTQPLP